VGSVHIRQRADQQMSSAKGALRRMTLRNLAGLARYLSLRTRYKGLHCGLFYIDRGAAFHVGRAASVHIGHNVRIMRDFTGHFEGSAWIGDGVFFNRGCHLVAQQSVRIGDNCLFGEMVSIHDDDHVTGRGTEPIATRGLRTAPVIIGNNVWVGAKASILAGVEIGDNTVIGAGAIVTRNIPPFVVAAGVPARVVREL